MKKQFSMAASGIFDLLSEEILFTILDSLESNPVDKKSFSLVCKSFYLVESRHRKTLKPLRSELLPAILNRYPSIKRLVLSSCPMITDNSLTSISLVCRSNLLSIDLSRSSFFSHVGISNLVSNCSSLVEIDLSNRTELTDYAAAAISRARNLERLWLVRCKMITDLGIGCIAVGCRKLKLINLKWCLGVSDLGVTLIAVKCKEVRNLDLSNTQITKKCLPPILQLKYLEELVLAGCLGIDDEGLTTLKQGSKSLQTLDMSYCPNVSQDGLSSISNGAACLRRLILAQFTPVTHALADSLQKLPKLQSIILEGCHVTSSGLKAIGSCCVSLKELSLSKCSGVTDEGLSFLVAKHKGLKKLDITCCRKITHVSIASITSSCIYLSSLRMESCDMVPEESFILIGQSCHFLEELDVTDNEINDEGLKSISKCSSLSSLKIGICFNITDKGLIHVGMCCPKLQELDLYRSIGITDSAVAAIARGCPNLQMINLAYCTEISDNSLRSLSKCSRLTALEIRGCPRVSSVGLSAIALGCKQITKLDIKKCYNVNDAGMLPLARLSQNLQQINLSYCSVTDVGLLALASISCLQNMTILHLRGLTANGLAAALLACEGLTKVKLLASFKSFLSQPLIEHIEARGCTFQWRDKPFQVDVDSMNWKQHSEDII
ncbi:RNI-like superfamily protein [Tasmannia lanceolata]|uniref:RNI-like superfamily protein n=1 Tax=Tasmannia lanceolata TaxID=3420 RepID=UPI0040627D03